MWHNWILGAMSWWNYALIGVAVVIIIIAVVMKKRS
jgi:hypothetical protein